MFYKTEKEFAQISIFIFIMLGIVEIEKWKKINNHYLVQK